MSLSNCDTTMQVVPAGYSNNGGDGMGWGGNWGAWIILFLIFGMFGWGGFGGGWGGNRGASAVDGYVLTSDFANVERKIDVVNNGLCDGFYAMNTGMLNGFAAINQNVSNGFQTAELSRANQQMGLMQQLNAMQAQQASCCCETREAIQGVNYNLATQACDTRNQMQQGFCAIQNTLNNNTRDVIDNQNANSRAILDFLTQDKIATLQAENTDLRRAASQDRQSALLTTEMGAQTAQIINALRQPVAVPAYQVPNPYTGGYGYGCAANAGCGC